MVVKSSHQQAARQSRDRVSFKTERHCAGLLSRGVNFMKIQIILFSTLLLLSGCAHYVTPGDKADLTRLAPVPIQEGFKREPSNPFPASIVTIRVQGGNYSNYNLSRTGGVHGGGNFTIITTREVESKADMDQIQNLPQVNDVIALNRLLIPRNIETIDQLREAASSLKADLILIYTFDTVFFDEDKARVLSTISLGFSPNRRITATTTASALLIDTRTGYIYSAYESTSSDTKTSSVWGSRDAADKARLETERKAFEMMLNEFASSWNRIVRS
jgi:hypothetical protein